jgi:hypothetical protein
MMCESLLKNKEFIAAILSGTEQETLLLTFEEWKILEIYIKILQPFAKITYELCESVNVTFSSLQPKIHFLYNQCNWNGVSYDQSNTLIF